MNLSAVNIGLTKEKREAAAASLARVLCDQNVLYTQARNFHWNIEGPAFFTLHAAFQKEYEALEDAIDSTAEMIRFYGAKAPGSMATFIKFSGLKECEPCSDPKECVKYLLEGHEHCATELRKEIERVEGVCELENYYQDLLARHEKSAWMLRSFLC